MKVSIILTIIVIDSVVVVKLVISAALSTWYQKLRILAAGKNFFIFMTRR